jgi:hypothetical protein
MISILVFKKRLTHLLELQKEEQPCPADRQEVERCPRTSQEKPCEPKTLV